MTFEEFRTAVSVEVAKVSGGLGIDDFADAPWRDYYDDARYQHLDELTEEDKLDVLDVLAECDDIFMRMLELHRDPS